MKFLFVAFALFAVINIARSDSSEEVLEKVKSKHLRKYLKDNREHVDSGLEKLEKECPGVSDKLKQALLDFHACDEKTDESLTLCAAIQKYTLNCTQPLLKVVNDCLPEKARGLPTLGVKSLLSVADYLCKQSGETIFELANPCLYEDNEQETPELQACEQKLENIAKKYKNGTHIPTTTEVCSSVTDLKGCVQTHVNTACKNQKTKDAVLGVYDALVAPCSHLNEP